MAAIAAAAELARMDVIPSVAQPAVARQLHFICGLLVAVRAPEPGVGAGESKVRARGVVELP